MPTLLLTFAVILSVNYLGPCSDLPQVREVEARKNLDDVGVWFINEGLSEYYQGKDLEYIKEKILNFNVHLYTDIAIDNNGYIAEIVPERYWVRSIITCYARSKFKNEIYEYWIIKQFGGTREDVKRDIKFLIAKAITLESRREIIHEDTNFFPSFIVDGMKVVEFPIHDDKIIYRLLPWRDPGAFKGSELEGIKVVFENKKYVRRAN